MGLRDCRGRMAAACGVPLAWAGNAGTAEQSPAQRVAASAKVWEAAKAAYGGNYFYKVTWSSWVGLGRETELVVRGNRVAERRYREWSNPVNEVS